MGQIPGYIVHTNTDQASNDYQLKSLSIEEISFIYLL